MKRLKLKQGVKDFLGIALFYIVILLGIVLLNARVDEIEQKNTSQQEIELVSNK